MQLVSLFSCTSMLIDMEILQTLYVFRESLESTVQVFIGMVEPIILRDG